MWAVDNDAYYAAHQGLAVLHAYDARNLAHELYSSNQRAARDNPGQASKFTVPTIANGKVFVGTANQVSVYGLLQGGRELAQKSVAVCTRKGRRSGMMDGRSS